MIIALYYFAQFAHSENTAAAKEKTEGKGERKTNIRKA
jgi:hypothetical protein